jgi:hypothetical protein
MGIAIVALVVLLCAGGVTIAEPLTFNANVVGLLRSRDERLAARRIVRPESNAHLSTRNFNRPRAKKESDDANRKDADPA